MDWAKNRTKYKVYPKPNKSVNVVHFSPGKKKVTIRVPAKNAGNIPAYLKSYFEPKNIVIQKQPNGKVLIKRQFKNYSSTATFPIKNPTQNNLNLWINAMYGKRSAGLPSNIVNLKQGFFFKNVTNNGKTGHALTSLNKSGGIRTTYNLSKGKKSVRIGVGKLGQGAQAVVYLGYHDPALTKPVSIKVFPFDRTFPPNQQPALTEFEIGKKVHEVAPRHTPKYISIERARAFVNPKNLNKLSGLINKNYQTVLFSEYFPGGDLRSWSSKVNARMNEATIMDITRQVLSTILKIRETYPKFRHNDLHPGNIFIDDTGTKPRAAIADFGMSCLTSSLCSHEVSRGNFIKNGVGMLTDERYDAHFFLNSLLKYGERFPRFKIFLNAAIPPGYRGKDDTYISNFRLKYGQSNPGLPSTKQMLSSLDKAASKNQAGVPKVPKIGIINLAIAKAKKRKLQFTNANLQNAKARLKPILESKEKNAATIAQKALANIPGIVITEAQKVVQMSPKTRAAFLATKKKVAAVPKIMQFKKLQNNATKAKPTNVLAFAKMINKKSPTYSLNKFFKTPNKIPRLPAKNILNKYSKDKNIGKYTTRNFRKMLERKGYGPVSAKREAKIWTSAWVNKTADRRANLKLTQNANGRIRNNRRLLQGYSRDELVNMAKRHKLPSTGKTKAELIRSLWS